MEFLKKIKGDFLASKLNWNVWKISIQSRFSLTCTTLIKFSYLLLIIWIFLFFVAKITNCSARFSWIFRLILNINRVFLGHDFLEDSFYYFMVAGEFWINYLHFLWSIISRQSPNYSPIPHKSSIEIIETPTKKTQAEYDLKISKFKRIIFADSVWEEKKSSKCLKFKIAIAQKKYDLQQQHVFKFFCSIFQKIVLNQRNIIWESLHKNI
jgi:hypothetical protein